MTHYRYSFVISVGEELAELSTRLPFSVNDIDQLTLKRLFEDLLDRNSASVRSGDTPSSHGLESQTNSL